MPRGHKTKIRGSWRERDISYRIWVIETVEEAELKMVWKKITPKLLVDSGR